MKLITELPHAAYATGDINKIDFQIEKMPIPKDQKKKLAKSFLSGKGIIGKMAKADKFLLFTPDGVKVLKNKPTDKAVILPTDWQKYAVILKDNMEDINMEKDKLREVIRQMIRTEFVEKLQEAKSFGEWEQVSKFGDWGWFHKKSNSFIWHEAGSEYDIILGTNGYDSGELDRSRGDVEAQLNSLMKKYKNGLPNDVFKKGSSKSKNASKWMKFFKKAK